MVLGKLLNHAETLHKFAIGLYGDRPVLALFEWPKSCSLWQEKAIVDFRHAIGLIHSTSFDGCSLGWLSIARKTFGTPLKKPLTLASTDEEILPHLTPYRCCGGHKHAPTQGIDTRHSQEYTK